MSHFSLLIDGNNLLYSTYHVLQHRSSEPVTEGFIAYSWINQIRSIVTKLSTQLMLQPRTFVFWDGENSRHSRMKIFPEYKGNRSNTPGIVTNTRNLLQQELGKICDRLNAQIPGIEADDLLFIMSRLPGKWIIVTRDEDLLQAVDDNTQVYNQFTKILWDVESFKKHYKFEPEQLAIYKALLGDTSDNYPGVAGIGKVRALKLINDPPIDNPEFLRGMKLIKLPLDTLPLDIISSALSELNSAPIKTDWIGLNEVFKFNKPMSFLVGK